MGLGGIIAGAIGGVADNRAKEEEKRQKAQEDADLVTLRANLETRKAKELADYNEGKTIATEQRKVAPLKRVGEAAQEIAGKEVPLQGSDVQSLEGGKGNAFDGQPLKTTRGMQGNVGIIMKQMEDGIKNETDPATKQQKIQDFENIKKQMGSQQDAEAEGKTRTVGNDEAVKIALDKLKVSDPEAYAAYQQSIGKSDRDEKRLDQDRLRIDNRQEWEKARAARLDKLDELKIEIDRIRQKRVEGKIDADREKAELQSKRLSATSLMQSVEKELEKNMTLIGIDPMNAETYKNRMKSLTNDLTRYRAALETFGGDAFKSSAELPKPPEPEIKYDSAGRAYKRGPDGKPVLVTPDKPAAKTPEVMQEPKPKVPSYKFGDRLID